MSEVNSKKIQISVKQLAMLLITYVISTADVFLPAFVAQEAKADSWISVILGTITSLIIINIFITLGLRYPNKTITQYLSNIVGKFIGKIIGIMYAYFFIFVTWAVLRELEEIFVIAFNPEAPILIYGVLTIIVALFAVMNGLECIARVNEIFLPLGLITLVTIIIINIPNINLNHFLPIMYDGFIPPIKGGLFVQTWMLETVVLLQIFPYVKEKEKIRKYTNISIIIICLGLLGGSLTIGLFGASLTSKFLFPALEYIRYATLGKYIQNLDISIMLVWITGIFVKVCLAYFAGVLSLAQVVNSGSYKNFIIPIGFIIVIFASASARMLIEMLYFLKYIAPFYFLVISFIIPSILLLISVIRGQKES